jgi:hypothetical protein
MREHLNNLVWWKIGGIFERTNDRINNIGQLKESKTDVLKHQYNWKIKEQKKKIIYVYVYEHKKKKKNW